MSLALWAARRIFQSIGLYDPIIDEDGLPVVDHRDRPVTTNSPGVD